MRKLPTLEQLRVANACRVPWSAMKGDERVRRCDTCKQNVYNLSEMTRAEAEQLIAAKEARICMRYYHRADGTMLLRDCAVEYRPTSLVAAGAAALALAGAALWAGGSTESQRVREMPSPVVRAPVALPPAAPVVMPVMTGQAVAIQPQEPIYVTGGPPPPPDTEPRKRHR